MQWFKFIFVTATCLIATFSQSRKFPDNNRIGGEPADIKDIPYQLSVHYGGSFRCGASIIGAYWAISAAHCFQGNISDVVLVAGSSSAFWDGQKHNVTKIINHSQYNPVTHNYDISVLKVKQPFDLGTPGIGCIPLANKRTQPGRNSQTSRWGDLEEGANTTNLLHKIVVPVISRRKCERWYLNKLEITRYMLCAGYPVNVTDPCAGDSGSPLVAKSKLIGVVSFGAGCGKAGCPGVYANVHKLRRWILRNTYPLSCNISPHKKQPFFNETLMDESNYDKE